MVHVTQNIVKLVKGRYIGECTRLIFDLIEKIEEDDIPGLLVLLDFEKKLLIQWNGQFSK
jgi:hypothetical protein